MRPLLASVTIYLALLGCGAIFIVILHKLFDVGGSLFGVFIVGMFLMISVRDMPLVAFIAILGVSLSIGMFYIWRSPANRWLPIMFASLGIPVAVFLCLYLAGTVIESVRSGSDGYGCSRATPQDC